ncbi:MAG: mannose-1-phosphate guanylyltransferase [Sandaracinaceae bacterium]|nr:mannose-1-phosphate guanylyltransferase [Sandaracinaceae bacterium]
MPRAFAVVMAGGSGTRFWPLSRAARPKQLLALAGGDESLLAATVRRACAVVAREDVLVVTSERLADAVRAELDLPAENVLAEPEGRNTAPCIGWAATRVARSDPDAVCVVLPSDHHIGDEPGYTAALTRAIEAAAAGDIVTVGIRPTRPETGYGYIEIGETIADGVHATRRFVEKPNRQRAEQLLSGGQVLWNSGMFFFQAQRMLDAIDAHLPGLGVTLHRYRDATLEAEAALVRETYASLPSVSIDHGVMEKVDDVAVVPADFGWSDLGSFASAYELAEHDADGNVLAGGVAHDARGCYVRAPEGKLVALIGVRDLVVIDTPDALLVMPRERAQDVKAVVEALRETDPDRL